MKPLTIRSLTEAERTTVQAGLKSKLGLTVRRSQMVLLSAEEKLKPQEIARRLGCSDQTVRKVLHAYEREGRTLQKLGLEGKESGGIARIVVDESAQNVTTINPTFSRDRR